MSSFYKSSAEKEAFSNGSVAVCIWKIRQNSEINIEIFCPFMRRIYLNNF